MPNTHLVDFHGACFNISQYPVLKCVGMLSDEQNWLAPMHCHEDVTEVIFVMSGEGSVLINGRSYPLRAGTLALYNPGVYHQESWQAARRDPELFHMKFGEFQIGGMSPNHILPDEREPVLEAGAYAPLLAQLFRTMFDECSRRSVGYEQMCHNLLESALIVILRLINQRSDAGEEPRPFDEISGDSLAFRAKMYIEENYMRKVSMRDIADELHISYYHLSHVFKQELNLSPQDYLISYRMNEASRLLTATKLPIAQIAARAGYANQSHFNVQFKLIKGMSPGQYRRKYSGGGEFGAPEGV